MGGRAHFYRKKGTLDGWKELASMAEHNSRSAFAMCASFAGPLLLPMDQTGGCFHFAGLSSRGKTTLLMMSGSSWGGGGKDGYALGWKMTVNGAEGVILDHNDTLLALDELTSVPPEMVREFAYDLANGQGKGRAQKDGTAKLAVQWRAIVISTGEKTAAEQMGPTKATGGTSVRMIDIPIECAPGETFENIGAFKSAGDFVKKMDFFARTHFGHAGPEFVQYLVDNQEELPEKARGIAETLARGLVDEDDDPQVHRVALRFALVGTAGLLAIEAGVLPWKQTSVTNSMTTCFKDWKTARGGGKSEEQRNAMRQLKAFFEANGGSRFEKFTREKNDGTQGIVRTSDYAVRDRCGYRAETEDGHTVFFVLPEAWRTEVCGDHSSELMAKVASEHGALERGEKGRIQKKVRLPDYRDGVRVYVLRPDLLP
jgi:putative DNA primase/helicase